MSIAKKVVVTGGAGFIGSHLAGGLARQGYHVTVIDDLSTGKMANMAEFSPNVRFIRGSITDLPLLQQSLKEVQYVFHMAAIPSVPRSITSPMVSHEANITGTLNVLLAARDNAASRVIFASSSSVYGDTPTLPANEEIIPQPLSPYAVTKLAGEYYCRVFQENYGLPTVCLRYFNVYGPRQEPNSQYAAVIPIFIKHVIEGKSPVIFGDGQQTRDFACVRDMVAGTILAAESNATGVFNLSRGESITIKRLAEAIIGLVGGKVTVVSRKPRPGDIMHSLADITRARAFGYEPAYNLEAGLTETIRWFNAK